MRWIFFACLSVGCSGHKEAPPSAGSAAPVVPTVVPADAPPPVIASCENIECELTLPVPPPSDATPTGRASLDISIDTGMPAAQCSFIARDAAGEWHQVVSTENRFTLATMAGPNHIETDCVPCKLAMNGKPGIEVVLATAGEKNPVLTLRCHAK